MWPNIKILENTKDFITSLSKSVDPTMQMEILEEMPTAMGATETANPTSFSVNFVAISLPFIKANGHSTIVLFGDYKWN